MIVPFEEAKKLLGEKFGDSLSFHKITKYTMDTNINGIIYLLLLTTNEAIPTAKNVVCILRVRSTMKYTICDIDYLYGAMTEVTLGHKSYIPSYIVPTVTNVMVDAVYQFMKERGKTCKVNEITVGCGNHGIEMDRRYYSVMETKHFYILFNVLVDSIHIRKDNSAMNVLNALSRQLYSDVIIRTVTDKIDESLTITNTQ